jgi:PncC family amidohydrolase
METRGEIIFLGIPSDIYGSAAPYLKALYSAGILTVSFTPIPAGATLEEGAREIEEIITAATRRADAVCVMSTRLEGWQGREEFFKKLLYRISRKRLVLQASGGLLPDGTSQFIDLNDIPLFMLPFTIPATHPHSTVLIMTPGTGATVYPFQSKIKEALSSKSNGCWIRMAGVSSGEVVQWIKKEPYHSSIRFKIVSRVTDLDLLIASDKPAVLSDAIAGIQKKFGKFCYSFDGESIEEAVGVALLAHNKSLAVAESCTGGEIAAKITRVPGASRYFTGGAVSYSNQSKEVLLSVPYRLIHEKGAVSPEVATRMANGIRKSALSDLGLSVTGIAGPTGGSREKPIGLVYIALASDQKTTVTRHKFYGSRDEIREQAVQIALETVLDYLGRKSV